MQTNVSISYEIQVTKAIIALMTFFMPSVNSSKVNLYGNKLKQKPEQPSGLLFITE